MSRVNSTYDRSDFSLQLIRRKTNCEQRDAHAVPGRPWGCCCSPSRYTGHGPTTTNCYYGDTNSVLVRLEAPQTRLTPVRILSGYGQLLLLTHFCDIELFSLQNAINCRVEILGNIHIFFSKRFPYSQRPDS